MDLSFIMSFNVPVVLAFCCCFGYVIKKSLDFIPNKYIPLIMLIIGTAVNCIINLESISSTVILGGMVSGLASTGLYEATRNLFEKKKGE